MSDKCPSKRLLARGWSHIACLALFALFALDAMAAKPVEDRHWIEVTTPHFTIRSTLKEKHTREMAHQAELLRAAVLLLTNTKSADSAIPTVIYALPGRYYDDLVDIDNTSGVFLSGSRQNDVVIRDSARVSESSVIKHEFVHELMRGQSGFDSPKWYIEGLAEYFEGSESRAGKFRVGIVPDNHANRLARESWIRAETLLSSNAFGDLGPRKTSLFYSQSWALVHYLTHAQDRSLSIADGLRRYADALESGSSEYDSFSSAFGLDPGDLRAILSRYLRAECCQIYTILEKELLPDFELQVSELSRAHISVGLGQIAVKRNKPDLAQYWFDVALQDPQARPRALAYSASLASSNDDFYAAEELSKEAEILAPNDPRVHTERAAYLVRRARQMENADETATYLKAAQASLVKAWRLDNTIPLVYSLTGQTYTMLNKDYDRAVDMLEQAVTLAPANLEFRYRLAHAYARANRPGDATTTARSLSTWSHGAEKLRGAAQKLIDSLEEKDASQPGEN